MKRIADVHHHVFPAGFPVHPWSFGQDQADMEQLGILEFLLWCIYIHWCPGVKLNKKSVFAEIRSSLVSVKPDGDFPTM